MIFFIANPSSTVGSICDLYTITDQPNGDMPSNNYQWVCRETCSQKDMRLLTLFVPFLTVCDAI